MSRRKKTAEPFGRARVEALWAKQVELDMSTAAFCAAEGLDVRTCNRWKGHLIGLRTGRLNNGIASPTRILTRPDWASAIDNIAKAVIDWTHRRGVWVPFVEGESRGRAAVLARVGGPARLKTAIGW